MIKFGDITIKDLYYGDIPIVRAYVGTDLVYQKDSGVFTKFPEYVDSSSTFLYDNGKEYLEMEDGEVVKSNMDLVLCGHFDEYDYLSEEDWNAMGVEVLTSYDSVVKVFKLKSGTPFIEVALYALEYPIPYTVVGCAWDSKMYLNAQWCSNFNLKNYKGSGFWGASKFKGNTTIEKIVCPDTPPTSTTSIASMFEECTNLREVRNFPQTANFVTNDLFSGCTSLEYVTPFRITNGNCSRLFMYCSSLKTWPIKTAVGSDAIYNTSNYASVRLFRGAGNAEDPDSLVIPDPLEVTTKQGDSWFEGFYGSKLNLIVKGVTEGIYAICRDSKFKEVTINVVGNTGGSLDSLFENCENLEKVRLSCNTLGVTWPWVLITGGSNPKHIYIENIPGGNYPAWNFANISRDWGLGGEENRQSVVDTLLNKSRDVAADGKKVNITLSATTMGLLTDEEKAAITAKGYTLIQG